MLSKDDNRPRTPLERHLADSAGKDEIIGIRKWLVRLFDHDHMAAMVMDQAMFWTKISDNEGSWFWKKYPEWFDELYLTQYQVKRAVTKINKISQEVVGQDVLEVVLKKVKNAPILHYRVKWGILVSLKIKKLDNQENDDSIEYEETSDSSYIHTYTHTTPEKNTPPPTGVDEKPDLSLAEADEIVYGENDPGDTSLEKTLETAIATPKPKGPRKKTDPVQKSDLAAARNGSGERPEKGAEKARPRDEIFDAIVTHVWGLNDLSKLPARQRKSTGGRVGQIAAWIKENYPGATEATIKAFTQWYGKKFKDAHIPRGFDTFSLHFMKFAEEKQSSKKKKEAAADVEYVEETRIDELTGRTHTVMVQRKKVTE